VRWERTAKHAQRSATAGSYLLRTSHTEWDLERVLRTYWQLNDVEKTFKSLKSDLGLRPVFHRRRDRIQSHLFIAVPAYHAVHLIRRRMAEGGIRDSWPTLREKLSTWMRLTTVLKREDGRWIETRQDSRPDPDAAHIARLVGVHPGLHRRRRLYPARPETPTPEPPAPEGPAPEGPASAAGEADRGDSGD